jgi:tripartite-type tricarboxylate transporter receptor subunit TctC
MKLRPVGAAVVAATLMLGIPVRAQDRYPSSAITVVTPLAPGTAIDILARLYGERLSRRFGQQVIVSNRPGAGGLIAAQAVVTAPADGYTLLLVNSGHAILQGDEARLTRFFGLTANRLPPAAGREMIPLDR